MSAFSLWPSSSEDKTTRSSKSLWPSSSFELMEPTSLPLVPLVEVCEGTNKSLWLSSSDEVEATSLPLVPLVEVCNGTSNQVEQVNELNVFKSRRIELANELNEFKNKRLNESIVEEMNNDNNDVYSKLRCKNNRTYYQKHKEKILERRREYYLANQEKIRKNCSVYYRTNRKECIQKQREYYRTNREECVQKNREYYQANREERREYYQANRDQVLERVGEYNEECYREDIKKGPTITCVCCGRLFFDRSLTKLTYKQILNKCSITLLEKACYLVNFNECEYSNDVIGYACSNCKLYLMKNKIPPLSLAHEELRFPEIPPELLQLNRLEERVLAPRIGFIQIRTVHVDQQKKSRGRIVNVPTNPEASLAMLPRNYENLGVIMVKLKKRKSFYVSVV